MYQPSTSPRRADEREVPVRLVRLIFVVEDDEDIARLISHNLQAAGFEVQSFVSGASVLTEAVGKCRHCFCSTSCCPEPMASNFAATSGTPLSLSATPIIFLTAKTAEADRVKGLELGGDDYITKPFSPRELVARIRTVLRGLGQESHRGRSSIRLGDLEIDVSSMTVQVRDATFSPPFVNFACWNTSPRIAAAC